MPENQELNFEGIERQPLSTFTEKAYLDYSMYVILDRALTSRQLSAFPAGVDVRRAPLTEVTEATAGFLADRA